MGKPGSVMAIARKVSILGEIPPPGQHRSPAWFTVWERLFNIRLGSGACPSFPGMSPRRNMTAEALLIPSICFRVDRFFKELFTCDFLNVTLERCGCFGAMGAFRIS